MNLINLLARRLALAVLVAATGGCSTLPRSGPDDQAIVNNTTLHLAADKKPLTDYVLIDLTEAVLTYFPQKKAKGFGEGFGPTRRGAPELPLGVGDIIEITLFESASGGLFIPADAGSRPGNFITLPRQTIDRTGIVAVPYAGQVNAIGQTPAQVQRVIEQRLADRAIEPQAVINVIEKRSSQVSVLGDVNAPAKFELAPVGERVLDLISRAGGISSPASETSVTLQRGNKNSTVPFQDLVDNPRENIFAYPEDLIFVSRERRTYLAFGASGLNGRLDFEESNLTLAEGVGKAGGLLDGRADPGQIFLYRLVDPAILNRLGFPVSAKSGPGFPVVFRANLRDPATFFLAQQFPMQDKDIIYVSNADSVELVKFFDVINSATSGVTGPIVDAASVRSAGRIIRN